MKKPERLIQKIHHQVLLMGAQYFRDHKKGIPEWLKNSDDSYTRHEDSKDEDLAGAPIILNFSKKEVACLDFGGSNHKKFIEYLPHWWNPDSATHGEELRKKMVSGGHGNGGKYYALSQFEKCEVINYYDGKLTILTINKDSQIDQNVKEEKRTPWQIIKLLGLDNWSYFEKHNRELFDKINNGELNLFCWRGIKPKDKTPISNKRSLSLLLSSISCNLQARSALKSRSVTALLDGDLLWRNINPEEAEIDEEFGTREFALPNKIGEYEFNKHFNSTLKVKLSKNQLSGDKLSLNILEIDSFGKSIAYYNIPSLMMDKGMSKSLIAHIDCPELKEYNCVSNDRVDLIESVEVASLFKEWCKSKIKEVLEELTDKEKQNEKREHLNALRNFLDVVTDEVSDLLEEDNLIKPTFSKFGKEKNPITTKTPGQGIGGGGNGGKGSGSGNNGGSGNLNNKGEIKEDKSENKKGKNKIKILLSNRDKDPLNPDKTFVMSDDPRWPILHQRVEDIDYGIWWINSQKRYIEKIDVRDPSAYPFYFFLVKEVVLSHKLRKLQKEQSEIMPDDVERENFKLIDEIFNKIVGRLNLDLSTAKKSNAEVLREATKGKEKFTINEISEQTGIDSAQVHMFLRSEKEYFGENYNVTKEKIHRKGKGKSSIVNVYVKK